ncbi:MAG: EAL domain-containing protein [Rhodospirillales bacterium]|nr:EAL domain-containing protein [Rhodospirillales bacterium]
MTTVAIAAARHALGDIRRERDRFAALSFCWADAVFELDPAGRVVYCAGACKHLFGVGDDALNGAALSALLAPADHAALQAMLEEAPASERIANAKVRLTRADGREQTATLCGFRLNELDGHVFLALRAAPRGAADLLAHRLEPEPVAASEMSVSTFKAVTAQANFEAAFQPVIDTHTGVIHHYEALARFPGIRGAEGPYEQIIFAEETGLIADFDLAMTRKVLDWLSGEALDGSTRVAVNISGHSLGSSACLTALDALLRENAWARGRLLFEITESAHLGNLAAANASVQRLRRQGFPVCLDDFGAGAANFEYLSSLEIDIVKLDGAAVRGARSAHKGDAFLKALVRLCRDLGVVTVAEMIEDEAALEFVRGCGVHFVQGYLFGRPAHDIRAFRRSIPAHLFPVAPIRTGGGARGGARVASERRS